MLDSVSRLLPTLECSQSHWIVLSFCEVDAKLAHDGCLSYCNLDWHCGFRYWFGHGSFATAFVIHGQYALLYSEIMWNRRAGGIRLSGNSSCTDQHINVVIIGVQRGAWR